MTAIRTAVVKKLWQRRSKVLEAVLSSVAGPEAESGKAGGSYLRLLPENPQAPTAYCGATTARQTRTIQLSYAGPRKAGSSSRRAMQMLAKCTRYALTSQDPDN